MLLSIRCWRVSRNDLPSHASGQRTAPFRWVTFYTQVDDQQVITDLVPFNGVLMLSLSALGDNHQTAAPCTKDGRMVYPKSTRRSGPFLFRAFTLWHPRSESIPD